MENIVKEFNKRFANGEQYIKIDSAGIVEEEKEYFWQERKVYNRILPIIEKLKLKYADLVTDELLYNEDGFVSRLIPIQRAYNALMNKQCEMVNRIGLNNLFVEDGSIDIDNLEEEGLAPGKIIVYRNGSIHPKFSNTITHEELNLLELQRKSLLDEFYNIVDNFEVRLWEKKR